MTINLDRQTVETLRRTASRAGMRPAVYVRRLVETWLAIGAAADQESDSGARRTLLGAEEESGREAPKLTGNVEHQKGTRDRARRGNGNVGPDSARSTG